MHLICDASLSDKVKNALDSTDVLVLEIDMDDLDYSEYLSFTKLPDYKNIKDYITDDEYTLLVKSLRKNTTKKLSDVKNKKPFHIYSNFFEFVFDCEAKSIEVELMKIANSQNEEILGLETIEESTNALDEIPLEIQIADLMAAVKDNFKKDKKDYQLMGKYYHQENLTRLYNMCNDPSISMMGPDYTKILLDNRNNNWMPNVIKSMNEKPSFFGVGAAHLLGENGLINLLRQKGYTVTPVYD